MSGPAFLPAASNQKLVYPRGLVLAVRAGVRADLSGRSLAQLTSPTLSPRMESCPNRVPWVGWGVDTLSEACLCEPQRSRSRCWSGGE